MDDQNQNNQPLDQVASPGPLPPTLPVAPSLPVEDITPVADIPITPPQVETTSFASSYSAPTPTPEPVAFPPTPEPTYVPPQATPVATTPEVPVMPTPAPEEPAMPEAKSKNKISPIIGGLVALLLVVGVAGAAYYVSNQLSTRQAVAPNAPESKPAAACTPGDEVVQCEKGGCNGCPVGRKCTCTSSGTWSCSCTGGGGGGGGGGGSCDYIANQGSSGPAQSSCDSSNCGGPCGVYTFKCGTRCYVSSCGASACGTTNTSTCDTSKRQAPVSKTVTFEKTGKVLVFSKGFSGNLIITPTTGTATTITSTNNGTAVQQTTSFNVTAGSTYTISVRLSNETRDAYGWLPPKSAEVCGPSAAICGGDANIKPVLDLAKSKADLTGIKSGTTVSNVQCWADMLQSDATQDYDFDDFAIVLGYETAAAPTCNTVSVYKKVNGVYGSTALTSAELQTLKVGDVLKFALNSNTDNLRGRFRVTAAGTAGNWLDGVIDATNKKLVTYSDYTVSAAGTYTFEGQVSITP